MANEIYLAEITAYDPAAGSTTTLRYATGLGHVTRPSETPASTYYAARIKQPSLMKRDIYQSGTTYGRSRMGFGDLILLNDDGDLDALLNYSFDGRAITIRRGLVGAAYPSGFTTVLVGTMQQAEFSSTEVRIRLRDRQYDLAIPLQPTKYAGSNALPSGLEGVSDLKGKPKPVLYGTVLNISPPCVNTAKLIYQVAAVLSGVACNSVDMVYDKGIPLLPLFPGAATTNPRTVFVTGGSGATAMTFGTGLFVAVGGSTAIDIATSPDGTTWTSRASFGTAGARAAIYANGLFVIAGGSGQLATSPDGITWTSRTSTFGATVINALAYGNGVYVAVGGAGKLATSPDGITWTSRTSSFAATDIAGVAFGDHGVRSFVAVGGSGKIATSPDGVTWTQQTNPFGTSSITCVAFGGGRFVTLLGFSLDGITWTEATLPQAVGNLQIITFISDIGMFVAPGDATSVLTSPDGQLWSRRTMGPTWGLGGLITIAYGNGILLLGGEQTFSGAAELLIKSGVATTYANLTDLQDDTLAPGPGTYKAYPAGGYFRLGSSPAGTVTADVTQGAASSDRTSGQVFKNLLVRAGFTSSDYSTTDITALDTQNSAVIGYYEDQETTFGDALDQVTGSVGAWWGPDNAGTFRIKRFQEIPASSVISLTAYDLLKPIERAATQDQDNGIPVFKSIVRYARNYTVQANDVAAGVTDARRVVVGQEWSEASYTDATVQTSHLLSQQVVEESLLTTEANALSEATRRQALRGRHRDRLILVLQLNPETEKLDLGDGIKLTHSRYGLSGGAYFTIIGLEPDAMNRTLTLNVWGPHAPPNSGATKLSLVASGTGTVA